MAIAATRITYHQVYISPGESLVFPHSEAGFCQVFDSEYVGGGADRRYLLHVAQLEPLTDDEAGGAEPLMEVQGDG